MKKIVFFLAFALLFSIGITSAVCTVTFDKTEYNQQETITALMTCSEVAEKNDDYTLSWTNATGYVIESNLGTTPPQIDTNFFESYIIDEDFVNLYGSNITATLSGGDTEGSDFANVTSASSNDLIITDVELSSQFLVGRSGGVHFTLIDENSKKINNARCLIEILDDGNRPVIISDIPITTLDGEAGFSTKEITPTFFQEGESYAFRIHCACGGNETALGCWDEDGLKITESAGSGTFSFDIGTWLNVNTVINNENYVGREQMFICANLTNIEFDRRIAVEIYHQVRCSAGQDNNNDTDRALIFSDDAEPDERGIDVGTTQMQCKRFIIPEPHYLQGLSSECYASTSVWVLNEHREKIMNYVTTAPLFNITITDINIDADWQRISKHTFNTIINLSDKKYSIMNAQGIGNIDVRLDKQYIESIRAEDQHIIYPQRIHSFVSADIIRTIVAYNSTGGLVTTVLEILDDGNIEIEIRDVDISSTGWINLTIEIEYFQERQSIALEGIENKTGTFHLEINCTNTFPNGETQCMITAQVEDSQYVEKEVDFTCYIDNESISRQNFNKMISRNVSYIYRNLHVPNDFEIGTIHTVECKASYYNLGSRTDTFSTTFLVVEQSGIIGLMKDVFMEEEKYNWGKIIGAVIVIIFIVCFIIWLFSKKKKKESGDEEEPLSEYY